MPAVPPDACSAQAASQRHCIAVHLGAGQAGKLKAQVCEALELPQGRWEAREDDAPKGGALQALKLTELWRQLRMLVVGGEESATSTQDTGK